MSGPVQEMHSRAHGWTYVLLAVTALATLVTLVQPRPSELPETARPIMLAE